MEIVWRNSRVPKQSSDSTEPLLKVIWQNDDLRLLTKLAHTRTDPEERAAVEYLSKLAADTERPIWRFARHVLASTEVAGSQMKWEHNIALFAREIPVEYYMDEMGNYNLRGVVEWLDWAGDLAIAL